MEHRAASSPVPVQLVKQLRLPPSRPLHSYTAETSQPSTSELPQQHGKLPKLLSEADSLKKYTED